ncbi:MAG TPA: RNase A-like domain-containing protein [Longimicrobium sp.]|nr:RNase A-like domain-containing protein [Longimicrobium sp.]
MYAGDQLLWEIKDTDGVSVPQESRGTVSYFQAGGIDRPLVIWKNTVGSIVTHQNWRGQFSRGTWGEGTGRVGQSSDCTGTWPQQIECVPVPWPGWNTNAWHEDAAKPQTAGTDTYWLGSLSVGMRDASGQMYMRNRYYNPQTGQFTQPDPIGLAGGLNSYGFAAGDPVTYSDPYGLEAECVICIRLIGAGLVRAGLIRGAVVLGAGGVRLLSAGLRGYERMGGHTISKHVNTTLPQLAQRLASEPNLRAASRFSNLRTAEGAVSGAIQSNAGNVQAWLAGTGGPRLVFSHPVGQTIGEVLHRGANSPVVSNAVRVVLERSASSPTGYKVITAYPQ